MIVKTEKRSGWLPDYREGYERAIEAIKEHGWHKAYRVYNIARQSNHVDGMYSAGFLSALCDLDSNKGRARTFSGNTSRPFGIR